MFYADLLKKLRKNQGWTLQQVGKAAGVSTDYVSKLERGIIKNPSFDISSSIAKFLGVDVHDLMVADEVSEERETQSNVDIMVLRDFRFARKWSLKEAADRAGIAPSALSRIENGQRRVSTSTLTKLAKAYEVDMDELLLQRENYVDLTALVMQSDTVIVDGREVDVTSNEAMERMLIALRMGAAWTKDK